MHRLEVSHQRQQFDTRCKESFDLEMVSQDRLWPLQMSQVIWMTSVVWSWRNLRSVRNLVFLCKQPLDLYQQITIIAGMDLSVLMLPGISCSNLACLGPFTLCKPLLSCYICIFTQDWCLNQCDHSSVVWKLIEWDEGSMQPMKNVICMQTSFGSCKWWQVTDPFCFAIPHRNALQGCTDQKLHFP